MLSAQTVPSGEAITQSVGPDAERPAGRDAAALLAQVSFLEEELALLRRKVTETPRHVRYWRSASPRPRPGGAPDRK